MKNFLLTKIANTQKAQIALELLEKVASDNNLDPDEFLMELGLEKAAEYLDEYYKEAGISDVWKNLKSGVSNFGKTKGKSGRLLKTTFGDRVKNVSRDISKGTVKGYKNVLKHPYLAGGAALAGAGAGFGGSMLLNRNKKKNKEASFDIRTILANRGSNTKVASDQSYVDQLVSIAKEKLYAK